jgi:hypothetical protein
MLILPGSILIGVRGIIELRKTLAFVNHSRKTAGFIVDIQRDNSPQGKIYLPVVEFGLKKKVRFVADLASRHNSNYRIGETIGVRYLPEKPEIARIDSFGQIWGNALLTFATGAIFMFAALFLLGKL